MKRVRVFLGGYVNYLNAQNINCRALSEHLNKSRFDVWTMLYPHQSASDFKRAEGVHYIKCRRPVRLMGWIPYFWGILLCNVAYLPKLEYVGFCKFLSRIFGCRLFTTLEGVLPDEFFAARTSLNRERYINDIKSFRYLYAITAYIAEKENREKGLIFERRVLYLGVETHKFIVEKHTHPALRNVIFIGFATIHKRASEFIQMAELFPQVRFHLVGGNTLEGGNTVQGYITEHGINNCIYHGSLDHSRLSELLKQVDLMFFPSRSEGFPKVMLETACAGVPTLCYSDYGAEEWVTNGVNGFVVDSFEEARGVIQSLIDNPDFLQKVADAAIVLGKRFDWDFLIKDWEEEIIRIYECTNE